MGLDPIAVLDLLGDAFRKIGYISVALQVFQNRGLIFGNDPADLDINLLPGLISEPRSLI